MPSQIEDQVARMDPVLSYVALPRTARFYPFGFPLDLATNSKCILDAAHEAWGAFAARFDALPMRLEIGVSEGAGAGAPVRPVFRARDHLMSIVSDAQNFVVCDLDRAFAFGWFTEAAASHRAFVRYCFLEAAVSVILEHLHLAAVHGALVEFNSQGVLLCGESTAGKSTLSYACARAGWTFISDEGVFLPRKENELLGLGNPHLLRLRPDASDLFPELRDFPVAAGPNGKISIEVDTAKLPGLATAAGSVIRHIVFLNRQHTASPRLIPYDPRAALASFQQAINFGLAEAQEEQRKVYRKLIQAPLWEFHYNQLDAAVDRLERLVGQSD